MLTKASCDRDETLVHVKNVDDIDKVFDVKNFAKTCWRQNMFLRETLFWFQPAKHLTMLTKASCDRLKMCIMTITNTFPGSTESRAIYLAKFGGKSKKRKNTKIAAFVLLRSEAIGRDQRCPEATRSIQRWPRDQRVTRGGDNKRRADVTRGGQRRTEMTKDV